MATAIQSCKETVQRSPYEAPAGAEEFERLDGPRVRAFAVSQLPGFRPQDQQDAAADIWRKLIENKVWLQYKSDHTSAYTGKPVTWKYFVNAKIPLYARGKREQMGRNAYREPLLMDAPAGDGSSSWGEVFGVSRADTYPCLAGTDMFEALRDWLALHPVTEAPCSLLALLDALADRMRCGESISRLAVARSLGLTLADAGTALALLKEALLEARGASAEIHRFTLGGVDLTAADVRTAIDLLKAARGNRVLPAWEHHPLADADPKWYIPFAKSEIKKRPELKQPKGSHTTGGHGSPVKTALLAGLNRLLVDAGAPEPESAPSDLELFEAELHRLRFGVPEINRILHAAGKVFAS